MCVCQTFAALTAQWTKDLTGIHDVKWLVCHSAQSLIMRNHHWKTWCERWTIKQQHPSSSTYPAIMSFLSSGTPGMAHHSRAVTAAGCTSSAAQNRPSPRCDHTHNLGSPLAQVARIWPVGSHCRLVMALCNIHRYQPWWLSLFSLVFLSY